MTPGLALYLLLKGMVLLTCCSFIKIHTNPYPPKKNAPSKEEAFNYFSKSTHLNGGGRER